MCSLYQNRPKMNTFSIVADVHSSVILGIPKMNTFTGSKVFIAGVHAGHTHNDTFLCGHAFKIDPLVQIDIEPAIGVDVKVDEWRQAAIILRGQARGHIGIA